MVQAYSAISYRFYRLCPKNEKSMADKQMNLFTIAESVYFLYGEDSAGNQVKISTGNLLQFTKQYKYNTNLDELIGKNARVTINSQYDEMNPTAAKSPTGSWAIVESKYFPSGGLTMQILTDWFNPQIRKIRNHENGAWDAWKDI